MKHRSVMAGVSLLATLMAPAAMASDVPFEAVYTFAGIPIGFILFGLTLLGVASSSPRIPATSRSGARRRGRWCG